MVKTKEKEQELGIIVHKENTKEDYHLKVKIIEFKLQSESNAFFRFQKHYIKRWEEISSIFKALEKFVEHYRLEEVTVNSRAVFALLDKMNNGERPTTHGLLGCC